MERLLPPRQRGGSFRETGRWVKVCRVDDLGKEDVMRFDCAGKTYAIYRSPDGDYFATDGICTHEHAHLADGLVTGNIIECPMHNGRFDYRTGEAKSPPVCIDLRTHPVKIDVGTVFVSVE